MSTAMSDSVARGLTVMQAHLAADCPDRATCWAKDIHDAHNPPLRCTCPVRSDAIGPHLRSCPNHPEAGWSRKCAYCGGASGSADVCCAECRQDRHAHCPSWPTCTQPDYGRLCDATR